MRPSDKISPLILDNLTKFKKSEPENMSDFALCVNTCKSVAAKSNKVIIDKPSSEIKKLTNNTMLKTTMSLQQEISVLNSAPEKKTKAKEQENEKQEKLNVVREFIKVSGKFIIQYFAKICSLKEEEMHAAAALNESCLVAFEDTLELLCDFIRNNLVNLESLKDSFSSSSSNQEFTRSASNPDLSRSAETQTENNETTLATNKLNGTDKILDGSGFLLLPMAQQRPMKKFNLSLNPKGRSDSQVTASKENSETDDKHSMKSEKKLTDDELNSNCTTKGPSNKLIDDIEIHDDMIAIKEEFDDLSSKSTVMLPEDAQSPPVNKTEDPELKTADTKADSELLQHSDKESDYIVYSQNRTDSGTSEMNNDEASSLVDNISGCSSLDRLQAYCDLRFCSSDNGSSTASDVSSISSVDSRAILKASKAPKVPLTKPCSVHLEQLDVDKHISKKRIVSGDRSEDRHIERLINLQSLERVRKDAPQTSSSGPPSKKSRTRKDSSSSSINSLLSSGSSVDVFGSEVLTMHSAELSLDAIKKNLDLNSSDCDSGSVLSGGSGTTKKRKRTSAKDRDKDKDKGQGGEQPAWMQDKLLTGRLSLADSPEPGSSAGAGSGFAAGTGTGTEAQQPLRPDSDCEEVVLSQDGDSQARGRRNIRKVKSDDLLEETTKLANQEEEERKRRRDERLRSTQEVLSQTPLDQKQVGLLLDVDEGSQRPALWVPASITAGLKDHQLKGIKFMWDACFESVRRVQQGDKGAGCILAHCMGLGKTKQVVVLSHTLLAAATATGVHKVLVVCPLSTVPGWRGEFARTLQGAQPAVSVRTVNGLPLSGKVAQLCNWHRDGGVLLIGYEMFQQLTLPNRMSNGRPISGPDHDLLRRALLDPGPDLVVCDEGHMLRNGRTLRWRSLERVATRRRIILTGTPLQNNLKEYYYMVQFVKPNLLGTYKEYLNRFVNPITNGQYEDSGPYDIQLMRKRSHVLHKKLEGTNQRFEAAELEQYLPPKLDYVLFVQLTKLQTELYRRYLQLCTSNQPDNRIRGLFTNYHNLQMVWTHPGLLPMRAARTAPAPSPRTYDEDFVVELDPDSTDPVQPGDWFANLLPCDVATNATCGPKLQILMSIVGECEALSDKLLVFSSSILELDLIEQLLQRRGFAQGGPLLPGQHYYRLDGTVPPDVRTNRCDSFNDPTNQLVRLLLISHKVGGLGLNLVAANRVVLMDVSWNPSYDVQSVFRVYRFGQTKPCYVYRLVSMGTMEEVVYSRAVTKLAVAGRVVDDQQILRHFKSHDLQRMYQLKCDYRARPNQPVPADRLLAKLLQLHTHLHRYQEHQALLENQAHEELTEHDMRLAWEEFEKEEEQLRLRKTMVLQPPVPFNPYDPGPNPMNYTVNPQSAVITTATTATQNMLPPKPLLSFSGLLEAYSNRAQPTPSGSSIPVHRRMFLPQTKPAKPKLIPISVSHRNIQRYRLDDASLIKPPKPNVLRRQSLPFVKKAVGSPSNFFMRPVVSTYQRRAPSFEGRGSAAQQQPRGLLASFPAQIHDKVHATENKRVEGNVPDDTDNIHDIITELDSVAELYERPPQSMLLSDNSNNARWPIFRRAKPKEMPQLHPSLSQQKDDCIITIE